MIQDIKPQTHRTVKQNANRLASTAYAPLQIDATASPDIYAKVNGNALQHAMDAKTGNALAQTFANATKATSDKGTDAFRFVKETASMANVRNQVNVDATADTKIKIN